MNITQMSFTFECERHAAWGLDAVQDFLVSCGDQVAAPQRNGATLSFRPSPKLQTTRLEDEHGFFRQLCYFWATRLAELPFEGLVVCQNDATDGLPCAEQVFYDGYVLGFRHMDDRESPYDDEAWRSVCWRMWIPLHGHFVDLEAWRTSADL